MAVELQSLRIVSVCPLPCGIRKLYFLHEAELKLAFKIMYK